MKLRLESLVDAAYPHSLGHAFDMHVPTVNGDTWPILVLVAIVVLILAPDRSVGEPNDRISIPTSPSPFNAQSHAAFFS